MQGIKPSKAYSCANFISNILNDPITALDLFDTQVLIGTIMGNVYYSNIPKKSFTSLIKLSPENISGVAFDTKDNIIIAIGDFELLRLNLNHRDSLMQIGSKIRIYPNENEHIKYCDKCFCFLTPTVFFKLNLDLGEGADPIQFTNYSFEYRSMKSAEMITGVIEMTNYSVPFDFDGDRFVWTENISPTTRRICVYSVLSKQYLMRFDIQSSLGHVSYVKLLPSNKLFIVRNRRLCEIRLIDEAFTIENEFEHLGAEVIAVDVFIDGVRPIDLINMNNSQRSNDVLLRLNNGEKLTLKDAESPGLSPTYLHPEEKVIEDPLFIATLDYDGNFNVFNSNKEETLFNLYKIRKIKDEYKDKEFFSVGFPYYIKMNASYYAISTDHGVFVIKQKK